MSEERESTATIELLDRHPAAAIVVDPGGRIAFWNRAATDLLGYSADEAIGQEYETLLVPPDLAEEQTELELKRQEAHRAACMAAERRRKDGTLVPLSITLDVAEGGDNYIYLSLRPREKTVCLCGGAADIVKRAGLPARSLTTRQRQVLRLIADGKSTRDIAVRLGLSVKTIETHRGHLMQRLKLKSVAGLVRYAVSIGLVPPSPFASKSAGTAA
jgi:PAS domain S-box-containing protein